MARTLSAKRRKDWKRGGRFRAIASTATPLRAGKIGALLQKDEPVVSAADSDASALVPFNLSWALGTASKKGVRRSP